MDQTTGVAEKVKELFQQPCHWSQLHLTQQSTMHSKFYWGLQAKIAIYTGSTLHLFRSAIPIY